METVFSPGQVRLGKHTGPEGAYMFSVGGSRTWQSKKGFVKMITMSNNHPESQNAILPNTEIPNAEPLLQPISEMTAEDIMKEAIRRGFKPTYGLLLHRWHSTDINRAYQFLESFELESEEV